MDATCPTSGVQQTCRVVLKSLWIKLPTVILAIGAYLALGGVLGALVGTAIFVVGTAVLLAVVMHPNASLWARTLSRAPEETNRVALTFDDGPDPKTTRLVARILSERGVRAAFFVVGERALAHPEIVAELHAAGHLVCNHSHTHSPTFHFRLWSTARRELRACNAAIASVIGREPRLFRSPQGIKNPALGDVLREMKLTAVGWQTRGLEALGGSPATIAQRVLRGVRSGGVILLHDGSGFGGRAKRAALVEALPIILDGLQERGLELARLDELLGVEPYGPPIDADAA